MSYILLALATWRISSLLVQEEGPGSVFFKLRALAGIQHDSDGVIWMVPDRFFAKNLSCMWCASLWVGIGWAILWAVSPFLTEIFTLPFALSAVTICVQWVSEKATDVISILNSMRVRK